LNMNRKDRTPYWTGKNMNPKQFSAIHREEGDRNLADAFEYIRENRDELWAGQVKPIDIPHFTEEEAVYIINCVIYGVLLEKERQNE